jgi:hypothetical protein
MRSILLFTVFALIIFIPVSTLAGPDAASDETMVIMEISGMS